MSCVVYLFFALLTFIIFETSLFVYGAYRAKNHYDTLETFEYVLGTVFIMMFSGAWPALWAVLAALGMSYGLFRLVSWFLKKYFDINLT